MMLQHVDKAAMLREVKFDWRLQMDVGDFAKVVEAAKEALWSRPRLRVVDCGLNEFRWGMRSFLGMAIHLDWWIDGYAPPVPGAEALSPQPLVV